MSVLPGIASIAAMALYAALFLHAESQAQVLGLVALAVVGVPVLARIGWIARTAVSLEAHPLAARSASVAALAVIIRAVPRPALHHADARLGPAI